MKNKTIGVSLLVIAGLALFLFTCSGPLLDRNNISWVEVSSAQSGLVKADDSMQDQAAQTEAEVTDESVAADATPVGAIQETQEPEPRDSRVLALVPVMTVLPPAEVPVGGMEAFLVVDSRDMEGGAGAPLLVVSDESLRDQLRISFESDRMLLPTDYTRGQPASTINTPTAYGQRLGDVYGGLGYQERIRYDDWNDGVASLGFGLGDPIQYVGLDVSVNILDTYTEFAEDRSLSLKLHRRLPYRSAIAVGHENIWHTDGTDGGSSRYVVVSKVLLLRDRPTSSLGSMVLNVGLGTDRFLPEGQFARGEDGINAFGSLGVRVLPPVNAVVNWTGQDLALGLSIAPIRSWPFVITPAVVDVTGSAGDGARFTMSAGLNYSLRRR